VLAYEHATLCFTQKGFGGVSVSDIANEAGYTKGAFFSNFPSREAMLLELFTVVHTEQRAAMDLLEGASPEDLPHAIDHLVELVVRHANHPVTPLLVAEVQLQAKRDDAFLDAAQRGFDYQLTAFAGWIDKLKAQHHLTTPMSSNAIARTVMALAQGYALQPADRGEIRLMVTQVLEGLLV
jgi:AcrR family transcriptional regulator